MALDKTRKNYQRKLNKKIRNINKSLREDTLWKGRFEVKQVDAHWERFTDNSGGVIYAIIRLVDKKDGYYKDCIIEYAPWLTCFSWELNSRINKFIVNDCKVWDENPKPSENSDDYRNIKVDENIFKIDRNYYNYFVSKQLKE